MEVGYVVLYVQTTEVGGHHGMRNFAFSDPEGRWFAVMP